MTPDTSVGSGGVELTPELLEALEGIIHFADAVAYRDDTLSVSLRQWIARAEGLLALQPKGHSDAE